MKRRLALLLAALAALGGAAQAEPRIRPAIAIDGDRITLGDLFDDAGNAAPAEVARAPLPGERLTLPVGDIAAVANSNGLAYLPPDLRAVVLVIRNAKPVPDDLVFDAVTDALRRHTGSSDLRIEYGTRSPGLKVGRNDPETVAVRDILLDERAGRFTALVVAPADDPAAPRIRVFGNAWRVMQIPVLARPISPGTPIAETDLGRLEVRADRVGSNVIMESTQLLGMTPTRPLPAGQPIALRDIRRPAVVMRGQTVMMVYSLPGIELTALGKAMDDGGVGDSIRLSNLQSRNVVNAVVESADTVRVPHRAGPPARALAAAR
ncbi:MAG: flagellar basal body P-ring formation protein FlgA [Alphaproteobacteria bacterium]|nr:flagellar basal body P-ring formation protein FlgA [Alphaproteobacteria bacterium]